jgi:hypothetical protein
LNCPDLFPLLRICQSRDGLCKLGPHKSSSPAPGTKGSDYVRKFQSSKEPLGFRPQPSWRQFAINGSPRCRLMQRSPEPARGSTPSPSSSPKLVTWERRWERMLAITSSMIKCRESAHQVSLSRQKSRSNTYLWAVGDTAGDAAMVWPPDFAEVPALRRQR